MARRRRSRAPRGASTYQGDDGRWRAPLELLPVNGKRRRKVFYGKTQREAIAKRDAYKARHAFGLAGGVEKLTVETFLANWLEHIVTPECEPKTLEDYSTTARLYILPGLGPHLLLKLAAGHVQTWRNELLARGLSATTVNYAHTVLIIALNRAVKWDYIPRNVASLADLLPRTRSPARALLVAQARQLLAAITDPRILVAIWFGLLGLRRGEALGVRWSDVDFDACTLTIVQTVINLNDRKTISTPKNEQSTRTVIIPDGAIAALRALHCHQEQLRQRKGAAWQESGHVITTRDGAAMAPATLRDHFKRTLKRAGLPDTTRFHDLRHTGASLLINEGVPLKTVSDRLGHSSIRITADLYGHTSDEAQRAAASKIDALLGETDPEPE